MNKKIIVAHPGKQHSFQTAQALKDDGSLFAYITTIYDKKGSWTHLLNSFLHGFWKKKGKGRRSNGLDDQDIVQYCELMSLLNLAVSKVSVLAPFRGKINDKLADRFGKRVANYAIKNNVDAVVMYDCTATKAFSILKENAPHIKRILDVSISHRAFLKHTYEEDMKLTGDFSLKKDNRFLWNDWNMSRYMQEAYDADAFLVPSEIVKQSLQFIGVEEEKIHIVPYGVDLDKFEPKKTWNVSNKLKMIYVGQVTYRKGIHHLLNAMKKLPEDIQENIELRFVGSYSKDSNIYKTAKENMNIEFCGFVNHDELSRCYQEADVFVFPTIGEGFGLVVLEAMACGLPVLCSCLAGGNDAIEDGKNGFVFDPQNEDELAEKIELLYVNRDTLTMGGGYCKADCRTVFLGQISLWCCLIVEVYYWIILICLKTDNFICNSISCQGGAVL